MVLRMELVSERSNAVQIRNLTDTLLVTNGPLMFVRGLPINLAPKLISRLLGKRNYSRLYKYTLTGRTTRTRRGRDSTRTRRGRDHTHSKGRDSHTHSKGQGPHTHSKGQGLHTHSKGQGLHTHSKAI
ncbi:hypothetical protein AVEN_210741-1 [Araneus ventricosus]|uniref:Uncharacterized protein n=1 Tax=Araneus ventricosus TaxID=182803 RepID=A0A4Y2UMP1_ARAVE|nr:hypothetical protein AVEN_210741-1 [Araneus ventricosus]